MRLLVTGGTGALGGELIVHAMRAGHEVVATAHSASLDADGVQVVRVDLANAVDAAQMVHAVRPDAVIHTAYRPADWNLTAVAPGAIAAACRDVGSPLVHISSDAVFSGHEPHYVETDLPDPVNPYGAAKAAAEVAVQQAMPEASIVRTSLILGHTTAPMYVLTRNLVAGAKGALFTDDIRCPVHVSDLAAAALELVGVPGVFHVAGPDALSRWEIGALLCQREGLDVDRLPKALRADLPVPGALDLRLDSTATRARLNTSLRGAREFIASGD